MHPGDLAPRVSLLCRPSSDQRVNRRSNAQEHQNKTKSHHFQALHLFVCVGVFLFTPILYNTGRGAFSPRVSLQSAKNKTPKRGSLTVDKPIFARSALALPLGELSCGSMWGTRMQKSETLSDSLTRATSPKGRGKGLFRNAETPKRGSCSILINLRLSTGPLLPDPAAPEHPGQIRTAPRNRSERSRRFRCSASPR